MCFIYCAGYDSPGFTKGMPIGRGFGYGRGFGFRRAFGRGFSPRFMEYSEPYFEYPAYPRRLSKEEEKEMLEDEKKSLQEGLKEIQKRLEELK